MAWLGRTPCTLAKPNDLLHVTLTAYQHVDREPRVFVRSTAVWTRFDPWLENCQDFNLVASWEDWRTGFGAKLVVTQLVKKFTGFYGIWRFITVSWRTHHRILYWTISIPSTSSQTISLRTILILSFHLLQGLSNGLFPSGFRTQILYAFGKFLMCAACIAHLILDFMA